MGKASKKKAKKKAYAAKMKAREAAKAVYTEDELADAEAWLLDCIIANTTDYTLEMKDGRLLAPSQMSYEDTYDYLQEKCKISKTMTNIVGGMFEKIKAKGKEEMDRAITEYVTHALKSISRKLINDPAHTRTVGGLLSGQVRCVIEFDLQD
jgi:hypothetical protein